MAPRSARAGVLTDQATKISEQSFAMLSALNAKSDGGSASPLLGPVASLSGDAETLKKALASGDAAGAAAALPALQADRVAIDDALKANPKAIKAEDWNTIKGELDQITPPIVKLNAGNPVASAAVASMPIAPSASTAETSSAPPAIATSSAPGGSGASSSPPPSVTIASRTLEGDVVHVKGQIQGTALKSAGIYENERCVKSFKVNNVPGEQRVELDIGIGNPPPGTEIRVTDAAGRTASAAVVDAAAIPSEANAEPVAPPSVPSAGPITLGSREGGVEIYRNSTNDADIASGTVKEIPSHGMPAPAAPSPSRRHTSGGKLANVEINVIDVTPSEANPHGYEVVGQIIGEGVTHAGVYVDGRLVHPISVSRLSDMTSFDETFINNGGTATIRAYGVGDQYAESGLDDAMMDTARLPDSLGPMVPMGPRSAPGIGVMITSVQPIGMNLYQVTGTVSGRNIASAGLYQNGVLAQSIGPGTSGLSLNGKGLGSSLGGMLGSLIPGLSQGYNFNLRYNPSAGYATIRAYDQTGAYTEQPIGTSGVNPYGYGGGVNPYMGGMPGYRPAPVNPNVSRRPPGTTGIPLW